MRASGRVIVVAAALLIGALVGAASAGGQFQRQLLVLGVCMVVLLVWHRRPDIGIAVGMLVCSWSLLGLRVGFALTVPRVAAGLATLTVANLYPGRFLRAFVATSTNVMLSVLVLIGGLTGFWCESPSRWARDWVEWVAALAMCAALTAWVRRREDLDHALSWFLVGRSLSAIGSVVEWAKDPTTRASGLGGKSTGAGMGAATDVPLVAAWLFRSPGIRRRLVIGLATGAVLFAVAASGSRGAVIVLAVSVSALWVTSVVQRLTARPAKRRRVPLWLAPLFVVVGASSFLVAPRALERLARTEVSREDRYAATTWVLAQVSERPHGLGVGNALAPYGMTGGKPAHNSLVTVLGETGYVGLIAYIGLWASIVAGVARAAVSRRTSDVTALWAAGLLGRLLGLMAAYMLSGSSVTLGFGIVVGLCSIVQLQAKVERAGPAAEQVLELAAGGGG